MSDFIRAEHLAAELGLDLATLFERVIPGDMPAPYWRRDELVEWVAHRHARQAVAEPGDGGNDQ